MHCYCWELRNSCLSLLGWMTNDYLFRLQRSWSLGFYHATCPAGEETGKEWRLQIHSFNRFGWCACARWDFDGNQVCKTHLCRWVCLWPRIIWKTSGKALWHRSWFSGQTWTRVWGKKITFCLITLKIKLCAHFYTDEWKRKKKAEKINASIFFFLSLFDSISSF